MQIIQLINVYLLVQQIQTIMLIIMCAYIIVQILCILLIQIQDLVFLDVQTLQRLILVMEIQQLADVFSIVLQDILQTIQQINVCQSALLIASVTMVQGSAFLIVLLANNFMLILLHICAHTLVPMDILEVKLVSLVYQHVRLTHIGEIL